MLILKHLYSFKRVYNLAVHLPIVACLFKDIGDRATSEARALPLFDSSSANFMKIVFKHDHHTHYVVKLIYIIINIYGKKSFNILTCRYGFVHYYKLAPGTVRNCEVAYSTDWRKLYQPFSATRVW